MEDGDEELRREVKRMEMVVAYVGFSIMKKL